MKRGEENSKESKIDDEQFTHSIASQVLNKNVIEQEDWKRKSDQINQNYEQNEVIFIDSSQ